jgi:acylphosphatase
MATPQVAGLAALLRATGLTSAVDVRERIRATADDLGPAGWDPQFGDGRINVYRALTEQDPVIGLGLSVRGVVNLASNGLLQAVVSTPEAETYGPEDIDVGSLRLGGVPVALRPNGTPHAVLDEHGDLVLHFSIPELRAYGALTPATAQVTLTGALEDGRAIQAIAPIRVR